MKQKTIKDSFTLSGKGLHTGLMIHARFLPSEQNTGIRICRVDLPGKPTYEALATYVKGTTRGTVLENGEWKVSTVEHALSALYAYGVTNCLIEVDAPEVPILDGSAVPYVEALERVGLVEQDAEAKEWIVTEPVIFDSGKGNKLIITPSDKYEVEVLVDFPSPVVRQQRAILSDLSSYGKDIAKARTFCFLREIKPLLALGLIKGGDLQNALVIYDKKIMQWRMNRLCRKLGCEPIDASKLGYLSELKYENEPARHKLLDIIGDLSLIGQRIRGRIYAERPGHGFNTACAKEIVERCTKDRCTM